MTQKNFLQIVTVIFIVCFISACTLNQALQGYEKGDYIASIQVITKKLDQKQGYPRDSLKQSWINTINLSLNKIENLPAHNVEQKIARLEKIYQARQLVGNGFYANEFAGFNERYPVQQIYLDIARLYYEKGNSIQLLTTESYREKAEAYEAGLRYADYSNMSNLAAQYRKEYATRKAEEYYQQALQQVRVKSYRLASEYFAKTLAIYEKYGDYKDARQQYIKYDKLWRTDEAARLFSQASLKEKSAIRKTEYRDVAALYGEAAKIYQPYGDYKNAASLETAFRNKGLITVSYNIRQDRGEDYCGSFYSHRLSERFKSKLETKFRAYPFRLSNSYRTDININIDYSAYFKEGRLEERNQVQSIVNAQGVVMKFNQRTETRKNEYELKVDISSRGDLSVNRRVNKQVDSTQNKVVYTGNVPDGYRDKTEGSLKDRDGLCQDIIAEVERDIEYALDDIARQALRL